PRGTGPLRCFGRGAEPRPPSSWRMPPDSRPATRAFVHFAGRSPHEEAAVHVVHVSQAGDGGVAAVVRHLLCDQAGRGWRVTLVAPPQGRIMAWACAAGAMRVLLPAGRQPAHCLPVEVLTLRRILPCLAPALVRLPP